MRSWLRVAIAGRRVEEDVSEGSRAVAALRFDELVAKMSVSKAEVLRLNALMEAANVKYRELFCPRKREREARMTQMSGTTSTMSDVELPKGVSGIP